MVNVVSLSPQFQFQPKHIPPPKNLLKTCLYVFVGFSRDMLYPKSSDFFQIPKRQRIASSQLYLNVQVPPEEPPVGIYIVNIADVSYFHSILKKVHDISELYLGIFFNIYFFKKYLSPKSRLLQPEKIFKRNDIQLRPSQEEVLPW